MIGLLCFVLAVWASPSKSKIRLAAENAALRHQLIVLRRKLRGRVQLANSDRWFLIQLYRYLDSRLNWSKYLTDRYFTDERTNNRVICLSAPGFRGEFSVLMSDLIPSIHFGDMAGAQCFPHDVYEVQSDDVGSLDLRADGRQDGISDSGLAHFQAAYPGEAITKDDLFYYVYGLLHSDDYRASFADNLSKQLPRIPARARHVRHGLVRPLQEFWRAGRAERCAGALLSVAVCP